MCGDAMVAEGVGVDSRASVAGGSPEVDEVPRCEVIGHDSPAIFASRLLSIGEPVNQVLLRANS